MAKISPLNCPTLLIGGAREPLAHRSLFMWGNVWYVWHLGVYFPGCLWVPGVEMWLLHIIVGILLGLDSGFKPRAATGCCKAVSPFPALSMPRRRLLCLWAIGVLVALLCAGKDICRAIPVR